MAGQASISTDILARYAADAARGVSGVRGLAASPIMRRRGVRIAENGAGVRVEREYLAGMADIEPAVVDVVDAVGPRR